ncbi:hypothetical protein CKO31_14265 [Thiohalocapsa halophila]|uniref:Glycosyltransferase family 2 protein n=1 Tax=Thiohalocapsa halophila TaxID=69359 RepID=A0ABS1CIZ0_9GAMM|nr:hypothetical protein [Thiohalocapsa halophila]MBK1631878.1 hypothetical protein [Thiohalocapsa halophila]
MNILVGITHCIENEFEQCLESIDRQTLPAFDRFVLSNLPNKEAHDTLYRTFMERAGEVDLFIKVDADMVLARPTFFEECAERFRSEPELEHLEIALNDWMTRRRIFGLHVYRSTHRWQQTAEAIFVDMVDHPHQRVADTTRLAPAAVHSPDPSPFQAYHFGVHKGVKFVQKGRSRVQAGQRVAHWYHFENLEAHFRETGDRRLALAVIGFNDALQSRWGPEAVDYDSEVTAARFSSLAAMEGRELARIARQSPLPGERFLPAGARFELNRLRVSGTLGPGILLDAAKRLRRGSYRRECPAVSRQRW